MRLQHKCDPGRSSVIVMNFKMTPTLPRAIIYIWLYYKQCHNNHCGHVLTVFWSIQIHVVTTLFPMALPIFLSLQHCAYCKRLGASIKCCAEGCAQLYHYPCAGAAGTFQDIRSLSLLCPEHHELAVHKCTARISLNRMSVCFLFNGQSDF